VSIGGGQDEQVSLRSVAGHARELKFKRDPSRPPGFGTGHPGVLAGALEDDRYRTGQASPSSVCAGGYPS
jgi:hypothetical protein